MPVTINGLNLYAGTAELKRYIRKRDAARKDSRRAQWERKITETKKFLEINQRRMKAWIL